MKVPDFGIMSERTVLDDCTILSSLSHDRTEQFNDSQIAVNYLKYFEEKDEKKYFEEKKYFHVLDRRLEDDKSKSLKTIKTKKVSKISQNLKKSSPLISSRNTVKKLLTAKVWFGHNFVSTILCTVGNSAIFLWSLHK